MMVYGNQQRTDAQHIANSQGYKNLDRTMIPGAGHNAFPNECVAFFSTLLPTPRTQ
jgi:hypothetical protein